MSRTTHVIHAALGAVSILVIGAVLGVLLDRSVLQRGLDLADLHTPELAFEASHEGLQDDLREDLGLSEEQATRVQEILGRHQAAVNDAWSVVHGRLEAAIDSVTSEIEAILDAEQRARLHEWLLARHGMSGSHDVGEGH